MEVHALAFQAQKKPVLHTNQVISQGIFGSTECLGEHVFDEQLISGEGRFALAQADWMLDCR
jgi:hypothetical protein